MSYIIDSTPDIFDEYPLTKLTAMDELFIITDNATSTSLIFNFEKRGLDARCIVQAVDYKNRCMSEIRSRTLRFKIKSVFSPRPFADEAITFTGGGFTASAIAKDGSYRLIAALPTFVMPSGEKGLKVNLAFTIKNTSASINQIHTKNRFNETTNITMFDKVSGTIRIGEEKKSIDESSYSGRHIRKTSTFPLLHNSYSSHGYGRNEEEFSFILSLVEKECLFLDKGVLKSYKGIETRVKGDEDYIFTNNKEVSLSFSIFSETKEKNGPFRKDRVIRYGLFSGSIDGYAIASVSGYVVVK